MTISVSHFETLTRLISLSLAPGATQDMQSEIPNLVGWPPFLGRPLPLLRLFSGRIGCHVWRTPTLFESRFFGEKIPKILRYCMKTVISY